MECKFAAQTNKHGTIFAGLICLIWPSFNYMLLEHCKRPPQPPGSYASRPMPEVATNGVPRCRGALVNGVSQGLTTPRFVARLLRVLVPATNMHEMMHTCHPIMFRCPPPQGGISPRLSAGIPASRLRCSTITGSATVHIQQRKWRSRILRTTASSSRKSQHMKGRCPRTSTSCEPDS